MLVRDSLSPGEHRGSNRAFRAHRRGYVRTESDGTVRPRRSSAFQTRYGTMDRAGETTADDIDIPRREVV